MIGIIAAMESECSLLKEALCCGEEECICGLSFFEGHDGSQRIILVQSGVGKVNAAMTAALLIDHFECDFIINTGIAGGLSQVQTEDVLLATRLAYSDVDTSCFGYEIGQVPGMPLYYCPAIEDVVHFKKILRHLNIEFKEATIFSADRFVTKKSDLLRYSNSDEVAACEMEGAAIAQVCVRSGISFMVLRYVSDLVEHPSQIDNYQAFEEEMAKRSSKICLEIIKNWE